MATQASDPSTAAAPGTFLDSLGNTHAGDPLQSAVNGPTAWRWVPFSGTTNSTGPIGSTPNGGRSGAYYPASMDPNNLTGQGITPDAYNALVAQGAATGEAPWFPAPNASGFSDFINDLKGFVTSPGVGLIASAFAPGLIGDLAGAAGVTDPIISRAIGGAATSALTGGNALTGAATGAFSGGAFGGGGSDGMAFGGETPLQGSSYLGGGTSWPSYLTPDQIAQLQAAGMTPEQVNASSQFFASGMPDIGTGVAPFSSTGSDTTFGGTPGAPGSPSTDQRSASPESPRSSFSSLLRDPNVSAPLSPSAPQAAAQVQTPEMARLDPPVEIGSSFINSPFGDPYAERGDLEAYGSTGGGGGDTLTAQEPGPQYQLDANGNPVTGAGGALNQIDPVTGQPVSTALPPGGASWQQIAKSIGSDKTAGSGNGFTDFLKANKNLLLPGAALAASALAKPKAPDMTNLDNIAAGFNANAAGINATANSLIPSVTTGVLPPGADALVNNALKDATASIKSKYAGMGLSGSTMEQQELASAEQSAAAQRFQMANTLTNTGLQAAGISSADMGNAAQIYEAIMKEQLATDSALQNALANFAGSAALGAGASAVRGFLGP